MCVCVCVVTLLYLNKRKRRCISERGRRKNKTTDEINKHERSAEGSGLPTITGSSKGREGLVGGILDALTTKVMEFLCLAEETRGHRRIQEVFGITLRPL